MPIPNTVQRIDVQSALISAFVGSVLTLFLAYISGSSFSALPFPIIAILSGFVVTGIVEGLLSRGVTILEPAIGAILVSIVLFIVLPLMNIRGFQDLNYTILTIMLINGIILSALGGWVGEKLQGTLDEDNSDSSPIDWGWVLCGAALATTITMLCASSLVVILGYHLSNHFIAFFLGLFVAGLIIGLRSPGIAITEAGMAGFIAVVINIDIVSLVLGMLDVVTVVGGIVLGILTTFFGGWVGETLQASRQR
ncbi:MAG: hypothetical protein RML40_09025 [Bacteroidota bacterium]|nr:hypothetical protein [Candidatus Kapabacteria bacterium]MDW8220660.1 hypothetical protein [Bacteroidota bacterium]